MAKPSSFRHCVEKEFGKLPHFFLYAILEWVLIILLFVNGFLAFLASQFAYLFDLKRPCLLCSRIDHIFADTDEDFHYNKSMCEIHKRDVSYLAYCYNHRKLSDIRKMCEACLLSFATEKESDCDTYKSLVGILHKDLECFVEDDNQIQLSLGKTHEEVHIEKSSIHRCSCCGEHLKMKTSAKTKNNNNHFLSTSSTFKHEHMELPHVRFSEVKFDHEHEAPDHEDHHHHFRDESKATMADGEENEDKTPTFIKGNKFFGIPLSDTVSSPRWATKFSRKSTLSKTDFSSESTEGSVPNEPDSESILHRLKRQVRLDRKSLIALYMELDEERNASAVAANNAMAMITRLQADKAAVQMEALQYQRMMEEQAEYDQEALQETHKIINDLEAELEAYHERYGYLEDFHLDKDDYHQDHFRSHMAYGPSYGERHEHYVNTPRFLGSRNMNGTGNVHSLGGSESFQEESEAVTVLDKSLQDFEGERSNILGQIKTLENKIDLSADEADQDSQSSAADHKTKEDGVKTPKKAALTKQLSCLNERVTNLETHTGFLKDAAKTLQKNGDGAKLLTDISENLTELRQLMAKSMDT